MKSEWRVSSNPAGPGGEFIYQIYRLRDVNEVDHSGNREFLDRVFDDPELAADVARIKNEEEQE